MKKVTSSTLIFVTGIAILWIYFNRGREDLLFYVVDLPLFVLIYGLLFCIGIPSISQGIRYGTKSSLLNTIALPLVLIVLYYLYLITHGQTIDDGASLLLPYLVLFPVLAMYHRNSDYKIATWSDLIVTILFLWPITLVHFSGNSDLPVEGVHFDSLYRMIVLLVTVYAFVVIRRLGNVGFWVDISGRKLWTTIWVWGVYIGMVWLLGMLFGLIDFEGWDSLEGRTVESMVIRFLTIFLHTAIFEELFFRGLLQNMLTRRIQQATDQLSFWIISFLVMTILALATGVGIDGNLFWLPAVVSVLIFVVAYLLSNFFSGYRHHYLSMAIISILFGLVHFHAGSVVYVGLAILAGWAYGYVFWKTRNVLYAALIHTLVNISPLLLGIEILN